MSVFDFIQDLSARQLQTVIRESSWLNNSSQTRPFADPQNQAVFHRNSFNLPSRIVYGVIVDYTPTAHCYKVQVDRAHPPVAAMLLADTSLIAWGAKRITLLQPGTGVWLVLSEQSRYGYILGTTGTFATQAKKALLDQVSQTTRARVDPSHDKPMKMTEMNGGIPDRISGRPFDGVAGEDGWITGTGLKITIDEFMVQLAVSEQCGVFGFYHDELLRVAGYNLQLRAASMEREILNDQEEVLDVDGTSLYPWEGASRFERGDPRRSLDLVQFENKEPWYAHWEPQKDKQQPFFRRQYFSGYLGQGRRESLCAPPTEGDQLEYDKEFKMIGLHQDNVGADGYRFISTASGFTVTKRLKTPIPHRMKRPEDEEGDNEKNYKASSKLGGGEEHKIKISPKTNADHPSLQRATAVLDLHAYLFNWKALHPFHYHKKDWYVPQESELDHAESNQEIPTFSELQGSMYLREPRKTSFKVDHRYGSPDFYESESFISLLEDGGIAICDGFGAEIRMSAGHLFLSAPGDIWLKSGRNVNTWAGWDTIMRSQNSMDVSTTVNDMRFKAEGNMQFTAGNDGPDSDGKGGMLFECRAKEPAYNYETDGEQVDAGGIVFKCKNTDFVALGKNIYLRTGGGDIKETDGAITIDANHGKQNVVIVSKNTNIYATESINFSIGEQQDTVEANVRVTRDTVYFGTRGHFANTLSAEFGLIVRSNVLVVGGHIVTEEAASNIFVTPLTGQGLSAASEYLSEFQSITLNTNLQLVTEAYQENPVALYYTGSKPGEDGTIEAIKFSWRTDEEMLVFDWELFEDRWQQMTRIGGGGETYWKERPIENNGEKFFPYPGKDHYDGQYYCEQNLYLYDLEKGESRDRPQRYDENPPSYRQPEKKKLKDKYPVIKEAS